MRFLLLLDLCLFAILQSATSQECKKVDADISGTNLVLNVTDICSCYKPEVGDPPTGGEPTTISKCDVVAVKNEEGNLSIRLQDLCSAECKRESKRISILSTETVSEVASTNTTVTKDSPPVSEPPSSSSKLPTNITTTSSTPVPSDLALNKTTTTSTPTETLNVSSSSTTLSTAVSVTTEPPLNTSTSTIATDPTVSSTKTSTTTLPITNKPSTNSSSTTTTTPTSVPDHISSETPAKETKSSHVHTTNETVTKAPPHSDEIKTGDGNANGSSTSKIVLFFFIGAVVGVLLVLVGSYVSKKYKSRAYEPREPAP